MLRAILLRVKARARLRLMGRRSGVTLMSRSAVVGLGASAGGVAPLQQFFADMNPESGLGVRGGDASFAGTREPAAERDAAKDEDAGDAGDGTGEGRGQTTFM